ncbi:MAG: hypothetical protein HC924_12930, partial [Synechococcaceae cyanobacterium SM2_3_2]|nr:hypothetical protein [Synechococcaceae cyanobacterium SM2_3_2]
AQVWQQGIPQLSFDTPHDPSAPDSRSARPAPDPSFWALLLMASRSQVDLIQEEFYGELTIVPSLATPHPPD